MNPPYLSSLVAAAIFSALANAQLEQEVRTGSRIPQPLVEDSLDRTREVLDRFAECSIALSPGVAHNFLVEFGSGNTQYRSLLSSQCLQKSTSDQLAMVGLKMSSTSFAFAVADALVRHNLRGFDSDLIRLSAPLRKPEIQLENPGYRRRSASGEVRSAPRAKEQQEADIALVLYGECVVRRDPKGAGKLLSTKLNSDEELEALQAMMPAFESCLDRGQQLKMNRAQLRGPVALNYYRLAYAPKSPAVSAIK